MSKKKPTGQVWHHTLSISKYTGSFTNESKVTETLDELEKQLEDGDRTAILKGITFCAHGKLDFPNWLLKEVHKLYYMAAGQSVESLDEFLGYKRPPGRNLESFERNQSFRDELYSVVLNAHNLQDAPLTRKTPKKSAFSHAVEYFEKKGKKIKEPTVERIYLAESKNRTKKT